MCTVQHPHPFASPPHPTELAQTEADLRPDGTLPEPGDETTEPFDFEKWLREHDSTSLDAPEGSTRNNRADLQPTPTRSTSETTSTRNTLRQAERTIPADGLEQSRLHWKWLDARKKTMRALYARAIADERRELPAKIHPARRIADRMADCGRFPTVVQREDGILGIRVGRCKARACPRCAAIKRHHAYVAIAAACARINDPRMVTLTMRASTEPLRDQIRHLRASFAKLRRSKIWRTNVTGGITVLEVTRNRATGSWHPHLHVVTDGTYIPQAKLSQSWAKASGGSTVVDIRRVSNRETIAKYVAKYITKTESPDAEHPWIEAEWHLAIHGTRQWQTFGTLHGMDKQTKDENPKQATVQIVSLDALAHAAEAGDLRAKRLYRVTQSRTARRLPDPTTPAYTYILGKHRTLATKLWTWDASRKGIHRDRPDQPTEDSPRPNRPPQRAQWLWENERHQHPPGSHPREDPVTHTYR